VYADDNSVHTIIDMKTDKDNGFHSPAGSYHSKTGFDAIRNVFIRQALLEALYDRQMQEDILCPRCGKGSAGKHNALSRYIRVMICDPCGTDEAMMEVSGENPLELQRWEYFKH